MRARQKTLAPRVSLSGSNYKALIIDLIKIITTHLFPGKCQTDAELENVRASISS